MKNILLSLCSSMVVLVANAQISIGPFAGVNAVNRLTTIGAKKFTYHFQDFQIGVAGDIRLSNHFSLCPNAAYERYQNGGSFGIIDMIGLLCAATYKVQFRNRSFFYVGAGPYIITPAKKYKFKAIQYVAGPAIKISDERLLQPLGAGVGLNAGFQSRIGIFFNVSYKRVMTNMASEELSSLQYGVPNWRYTNYGLSAGYLFKLSKKKDTPKKSKEKE